MIVRFDSVSFPRWRLLSAGCRQQPQLTEGRQQSQLLRWQTAAAAGGCGLSCGLAEHVLPGDWLSAQPKLNVDKQT